MPTARKVERDYSHRSLAEKLGLKPELRIYARNIDLGIETVASLRGEFDIILYQVNAPRDLDAIVTLATHLRPAGALWIFHPKGKGANPNEHAVRASGIAAGLVDNKVSAYSATHTATRYVIPVKRRQS